MISKVINHFNLPKTASWNSPVGLAILAQFCNYCAKTVNPIYYDWKVELLKEYVEKNYHYSINCNDKDNLWEGGIFYIETEYGQLSFHFFEKIGENIPNISDCKWSGISLQFKIVEIMKEFLEDDGILKGDYPKNSILR